MKLRFLWIGKTRDLLFSNLEDKYLKRVEQFFTTDRTQVSERKKSDPRARAAGSEQDADRIRKRLSPDTYLVALDPGGRELTSPQLASFLEELAGRGVREVAFVVGGHSGIPETIRDSADMKFSLSKLTLPHRLARVILLEQIYRAATICRSLPYHK